MNKCIFLDRDGVLNKDKLDYVYTQQDHIILEGVIDALKLLKQNGFLLVIITNQSGIAKGLYTSQDVKMCYGLLQEACGNIIDGLYFASYHPDFDSECLTRKPKTLLFEKAIAKFHIDTSRSWMVGDKIRDLIPAQKLGIKTTLIESGEKESFDADIITHSLWQFAKEICSVTH